MFSAGFRYYGTGRKDIVLTVGNGFLGKGNKREKRVSNTTYIPGKKKSISLYVTVPDIN